MDVFTKILDFVLQNVEITDFELFDEFILLLNEISIELF